MYRKRLADAQPSEDEDFASYLDLFTGFLFLTLLLVLMLFLLMGDKNSETYVNSIKEKNAVIEKLESNIVQLEKALETAKLQAMKVPDLEQDTIRLAGKNAELIEQNRQWKALEGVWFAERKRINEESEALRASLSDAQEQSGKTLDLQQEVARLVTKNAELTELNRQWKLLEGNWFAERKKKNEENSSLQLSLSNANIKIGEIPGLLKKITNLEESRQKTLAINKDWKIAYDNLASSVKQKEEKISGLESKVTTLEQTLIVAYLSRRQDTGLTEVLNATDFDPGSAVLPSSIENAIRNKIPDLEVKAQEGYNTIEIIGHTDEDPVNARDVTADDNQLAMAITNPYNGSLEGLYFKSNIELGMARALSVYREIAKLRYKMPTIKYIRVYSAGQYVKNGNIDLTDYSGRKSDTPSRRRIEVRLTRTE